MNDPTPNVRQQITSLSAAKKGSLGENFALAKVKDFAGATSTRGDGCGADFRLSDGRLVDVKLWIHRPRHSGGDAHFVWIDYLAKCSEKSGKTTVWLISAADSPRQIGAFDNSDFEEYYLGSWKTVQSRKHIEAAADTPAPETNRKRVTSAAKILLLQKYPLGETRFLSAQRISAYGGLTRLPEIVPDNREALNDADRTILIVGSKNWTQVLEYWVFEHSDFAKIKDLLKDDGGGQFRIPPTDFPKEWIFPWPPSHIVPFWGCTLDFDEADALLGILAELIAEHGEDQATELYDGAVENLRLVLGNEYVWSSEDNEIAVGAPIDGADDDTMKARITAHLVDRLHGFPTERLTLMRADMHTHRVITSSDS